MRASLPERPARPQPDARPLPVVRAVATAVPEHRVTQAEVREVAQRLFPRLAARESLLGVFGNARIDARHLAMPLDWYAREHGWAEKNATYAREALRLSERAARDALHRAAAHGQDVDAVVFVSSTGISTPSLDSHLIERLGLNRQAARLPLWGLGCAGGAAGLARAADLVRAGYRQVLLVAVELCSLTFVRHDERSSNFVGVSLFADGAAALLLGPHEGGPAGMEAPASGPRVHGSFSTLIPDSADIMGWDVANDGLRVRFSRDIPTLVRGMMRENVREALERHGWTRDDLRRFVVHPGGVKVLDAYQDSLQLAPGALDASREVLRTHGNMSGPSVLFVLERVLREQPAGRALLSAMGPGFSAEHVLLDF